jgi:hypothetical protein
VEQRIQGIEDTIKSRYEVYFNEPLDSHKAEIVDRVVGLTLQFVQDRKSIKQARVLHLLESMKIEIENPS